MEWAFPVFGFALAAGIMGILLMLALVVFWVWMIVDCAKRSFKNDIEKILWILAIVFLTWVGALVYFIVIKMINHKGIFK